MKAEDKCCIVLILIIVSMALFMVFSPAFGDYKTLNATKMLIVTELGNVVAYEYVWNGSPCHIVLGTGVECI